MLTVHDRMRMYTKQTAKWLAIGMSLMCVSWNRILCKAVKINLMYQKNPGIDTLKNLHEFIREVNLSVPRTGRQELCHHRQLSNFRGSGFRVENRKCHILCIKTHTRSCIFNVKVLKVLRSRNTKWILTPHPSPEVITVHRLHIYIQAFAVHIQTQVQTLQCSPPER